jgi:2,4-dienoyl-CoA reductase-like NADH-dependent reductase (Old Yellow Enzyme family)
MNDGSIDGGQAAMPMLFAPLSIRGLTLKNRLVVPPMVHYRCDPGNTCGTFHVVHLGRYALGGFGLVFVEATGVEEIGIINEHDLGIWNDAQAESFKPLIAFMKRQGTAIGIQLAHGGRKASSQTAMQGMGPLTEENLKAGAKLWQPVGPTAEPVAKGWLTPRQLTTAECKAVVGTWAAAAKRAVAAGFDVIEIHAAHGYLLASFLSPVSNTRNDEYGGDRAGRMRLPLEIVEAVRREMPAAMPLFLRVSSVDGTMEGWNMDDTVAFARELKLRGVDVIDCSSGVSRVLPPRHRCNAASDSRCPLRSGFARRRTFQPWPSASFSKRSRPKPFCRTARPISSRSAASRSSTRTLRCIGRTTSASIRGSRTGRPNMAGGSRSGSGPWTALPLRPALSRDAREFLTAVIASEAKQSSFAATRKLDCFVAEPVIGRAFARSVGSSQ